MHFLISNSIDILALCETKLADIILPTVDVYTIYRKDRSENGGGIAILVKTYLRSQIFNLFYSYKHF